MENKHVSPKDVFMHFLSIIMLYAGAISFLVVIFQIINLVMPDLMAEDYIASYQIENVYNLIRGALAFLIITYPVYVLSTWLIKKSYAKEPYKKEMRLRKWLVYFTLFITALIIIGTLISLLIGFLYGDLTLAFALKVLAVFFVAGNVFGYYIFDLKDKYDRPLFYLFLAVSVIVLAAIITGFFFIGSPAEQRLRNADQQKTYDLEMLNSEINNYYYTNKKLPEDIINFSGYKKDYQYQIVDESNYQICAEFNLSSYGYEFSQKYQMEIPANTFEHASGQACFDRQVYAEQKIEVIR